MHVLITGAAGMIGRKFAEQIATTGGLKGSAVDKLTLVDVIEANVATEFSGGRHVLAVDLSDTYVAETLIKQRPDVIVHLAAVVSSEAEADFEKGYAINLDGTRALFDAIARTPDYKPRVVYASSLAVFGAPFPKKISDEFHLTPLTSYGTQKAIGELLLDDYTRRGFFDGIGIRFPTICIRPGKPNKAASGFFSNIIREPLNGHEAVLPVDKNLRHWHASPRAAVGFLEHAARMDTAQLGHRRNLTMPGVSATVAEQIAALQDIAGQKIADLIRYEPDPDIQYIVAGWPRDFEAARAREHGFKAETSFHEIIRVYLEDELDYPLT